LKNALAYYNAGVVVAVNAKVIGLVPGLSLALIVSPIEPSGVDSFAEIGSRRCDAGCRRRCRTTTSCSARPTTTTMTTTTSTEGASGRRWPGIDFMNLRFGRKLFGLIFIVNFQ
jgi:hypothetical protein